MPELPEVETVRQTLRNFILNAQIARVTVLYEKIVVDDPEIFISALSGQTIHEIDRIGKYLIFILDDIALISHLRMEGKYKIVPAGAEIGKHEHVIFHLEDGRELRYQDTRKFGRMELTDIVNYRCKPPFTKLGPEPFVADPETLYQRLRRTSLPIKSLLLDQSILNGIGNIYANEICFRMKMHPLTPGNRLTKKQVKDLVRIAAEILNEAIALGGTTIHSFDSVGISGLFQTKLRVHAQTKCPVCENSITKIAVGGRGTYYCKNCQKYGKYDAKKQ